MVGTLRRWTLGERLGEAHVWKTLGGAVRSITNIYSLVSTLERGRFILIRLSLSFDHEMEHGH